MNDIVYNGDYNYTLLLIFNQSFIDSVRSSGGYNKERLSIFYLPYINKGNSFLN